MNENRVEGAAKVIGGRFQRAAGELFEDREMRIRGGVREGVGHIQETAGAVQEIFDGAVGYAKTAGGAAGKAYGGVTGFARTLTQTIEERSYLSVAAAAALGLLAGLLIASRRPSIIYVKPRA
jgi:uncharacterized protein YjbJ (UPF0337 family)